MPFRLVLRLEKQPTCSKSARLNMDSRTHLRELEISEQHIQSQRRGTSNDLCITISIHFSPLIDCFPGSGLIGSTAGCPRPIIGQQIGSSGVLPQVKLLETENRRKLKWEKMVVDRRVREEKSHIAVLFDFFFCLPISRDKLRMTLGMSWRSGRFGPDFGGDNSQCCIVIIKGLQVLSAGERRRREERPGWPLPEDGGIQSRAPCQYSLATEYGTVTALEMNCSAADRRQLH
ncbi:hypothetical protein ASPWEDRAFT_522313 [Aspergillus wentii DTO 134E9]|uniref:Uncharacterized protein n=1 Tax=Aspergillus wentii DTO 134E9 TaxID=1073089 RepID=A0A1L9RL96_ASPWE|nr:uncharacterized protein ASPWEDRAFT_522313 [Aspergillus wentii DTO 134E9]OJJ35710.1 hypothetical protein ASPWEDRAFT_522313 [Aspergillus wentii DTO 134E9]